jgi:hypothetical protein
MPGLVEELRGEAAGELLDLAGEFALLRGELLDPPREGFQCTLGAAELGVAAAVGTGRAETSEQPCAGERPQFAAQRLGGGDEQTTQLAERGRSRGHGAFTRCHQCAQRLAFSVAARQRGSFLAEDASRRADRVEGVGLAAGATFTAKPADLEHPLATVDEEASKTRAEGSGSFDGERAPAGRMPLGESQRLLVASSVCSNGGFEYDRAGPYVDDPDRVRVSVRVDADDVVQLICEHPDRPPAQVGGHVPVPVWGVEPRAAEL